MIRQQPTGRALEVLWHARFSRYAIQSIHWWPDRLPSATLASAARLECLELRADAAPRSGSDDGAYDEALTQVRGATQAVLDTGVLGLATRVVVSEPALPSRLRTYRGLFYKAPELKAGPRLQLERPYGPGGETVLVGFEPVDARDGYVGLGGTLILHPPPRIDASCRGLLDEILAAYDNERGFWQDDTKLVARIVRGDIAVLLFNYSPDRYWNACLYFEEQRSAAVRSAWEMAKAAIGPKED